MDEKLKKYILSVSLTADTKINDLKILKVIGVGSHGAVYEALDTVSQQIIAIKEFFPVRIAARNQNLEVNPARPEDAKKFQTEKQRFLEKGLKLSRIVHPNIVRLSKVIEENNTVYLLMDKIEGASLFEKLGPDSFIPPEVKKVWIDKLLDAIRSVHNDGNLHLAIEPSNIIINEKLGPVLIDFGYSDTNQNDDNTSGLPYYPIETTNSKSGSIGKHTDIYSAGAIFYHLLSGNPPVPASSRIASKTDPQPRLTSMQSVKSLYSKKLLESIDQSIAVKPENRFENVSLWQESFNQKEEAKAKFQSRVRLFIILGAATLLFGWLLYGKNYYAENKLWTSISANNDPCATREYSENYPDGRFSEEAKTRITLCEEREFAEKQTALSEKLLAVQKIVGKTIQIQPGCFQMGSDLREVGRGNDERLHDSCINNAYELAIHEVTIGQFRAFTKATNYKTDAEKNIGDSGCWALDPENIEESWAYQPWASWQNPYKKYTVDDSHPVSCVSPNDVNQYIAWINSIADTNYRLPTESEWEFAVRGRGTTSTYFWGNVAAQACEYSNVADQTNNLSLTGKAGSGSPWPSSHNCIDNHVYASPVGSYKPSFNGLYDMIGNVWEMTCSQYSGSYGDMESDCATIADDEEPTLTDKGGSWESNPAFSRSATRGQIPFFERGSNIGFRLAKTVE